MRFIANACERADDLVSPPGFVIGIFPLKSGRFEVYSAIRKGEDRGNVVRLETDDFRSYSELETVMRPDPGRRAWVATMTRKPDGSEYLLNASASWEKTFGLFFYRSSDGRTFEPLTEGPAFTDHDAAYLFHGDKTLPAQRQAYIMVEALDEVGKTIPGFEKEACLFRDADAIRLPLRWGDSDTTSLEGRKIALRFHFRDARLYGLSETR